MANARAESKKTPIGHARIKRQKKGLCILCILRLVVQLRPNDAIWVEEHVSYENFKGIHGTTGTNSENKTVFSN